MRWKTSAAVCLSAFFLLTGCSSKVPTEAGTEGYAEEEISAVSTVLDADDTETGDSEEAISAEIALNGNQVSVEGTGVQVDGTAVTITAAGTYRVSGTLSNGQLLVDATNDSKVRLILNGAEILCTDSAPIYVKQADKVILTLAAGTENVLTDGETYSYDDAEAEEPNAVIFSKDDLTINGEGSLTVNGNFNNGIQSKDDLKITGGTLSVTAVHNGIKGKDSVTIRDAVLTVSSGGDGIQSDNTEDAGKGYILIESGVLSVEAGEDGIQAETVLQIDGGELTVVSGGGSGNSSTSSDWGDWGMLGMETAADSGETEESAKGIKAGSSLSVSGGTISIDSSDDAVHTNGSLAIQAGSIELSSGDDGIHADANVEIGGGTVTIAKSYEGIEGANISLNGGEIHVTASDDGLNAAGGNDGSSIGGRPGQNAFIDASGEYCITVSGGYTVLDTGGDGVDSNGDIVMTDGTLLVNGPTDDGNGALDYAGSFTLNGGLLLAAGSSGMLQTPDAASSQYTASIRFSSSQEAGSPVCLFSTDGETEIIFAPSKPYTSLIISAPELQAGETYTVKTGGTASGEETDGFYSDGVYEGGSEYISAALSEVITQFAPDGISAGGMMGGMSPGGMPEMDGQRQEPPGGFDGEGMR